MARNKYDVDETLETKFDMKQIKRLFSYVGRYRKKLIMTIMLAVFLSAWHGYSCADAARNGYLHSESRQKGNPFDGGACSFDNFGNSLHTSYQD